MDDLISRQAAIDALGERPTVWTSCDEYALGERNQYDCDRLAIETVPPAVVRCKYCKHSHPWYADRRTCVMWSETGVSVFNDGFCSYGERMNHPMEDFESANLSTGEFEPHRGPTDRYMFDCEDCLNKEITDGATFCIPLREGRYPLNVEDTTAGWRLVCHEYQPSQTSIWKEGREP